MTISVEYEDSEKLESCGSGEYKKYFSYPDVFKSKLACNENNNCYGIKWDFSDVDNKPYKLCLFSNILMEGIAGTNKGMLKKKARYGKTDDLQFSIFQNIFILEICDKNKNN